MCESKIFFPLSQNNGKGTKLKLWNQDLLIRVSFGKDMLHISIVIYYANIFGDSNKIKEKETMVVSQYLPCKSTVKKWGIGVKRPSGIAVKV